MDQLPDEVLLHVLQFLDALELLCSARAVCRRWRGLALRPELWRHRRVNLLWEPPSRREEAVAVLTLQRAPRLRLLSISSDRLVRKVSRPPDPMIIVHRVQSAVEELQVSVYNRGSSQALRLVREQMDLKRLRILSLRVQHSMSTVISSLISEVVRYIASYPQLEELTLWIPSPRLRPLPHLSLPASIGGGETPAPSLKRLEIGQIEGRGELLPVLSLFLDCSAGSLERLELNLGCAWPGAALAAALRRCARLRELSLPEEDVPKCLPHCPQVTRLEVYVPGMSNGGAALLPALRAATHLESLSLRGEMCAEVFGWVAALASSGRAQLQSLLITEAVGDEDEFPWMTELLPALRGLPRLATLEFVTYPPPVAFLEALTRAMLPRLEFLRVDLVGRCAERCYVSALRALLCRLPGLHVACSSHDRNLNCSRMPGCGCVCCLGGPVGDMILCGCLQPETCWLRGQFANWLLCDTSTPPP